MKISTIVEFLLNSILQLKGTMNIFLTIQINFEAVLMPFMIFFNDFRKLQRYGISVSKLGCLFGRGAKDSIIKFYKSGMKSEERWVCRLGFSNKIKPSGVWDLATIIFGTDNKYYNTEEKNKLFSTDKSNSKYHLLFYSLLFYLLIFKCNYSCYCYSIHFFYDISM